MLEETIMGTRLIMRYPSEADPRARNSFTFRHLALDAANAAILDLSDAFRSLMYDPAMAVETIKGVTTDLYMPG